jgi:hypothetical protein
VLTQSCDPLSHLLILQPSSPVNPSRSFAFLFTTCLSGLCLPASVSVSVGCGFQIRFTGTSFALLDPRDRSALPRRPRSSENCISHRRSNSRKPYYRRSRHKYGTGLFFLSQPLSLLSCGYISDKYNANVLSR